MAPNSRVSPSRPALPATAALLIFDLQKAFQVSEREAEINAARLLATWRAGGGPVIHVQHLSREPVPPNRPRRPGGGAKHEARPRAGEFVIQKFTHDAFIDTGLAPFLAERGIDTLVVAGVSTNASVEATVGMAGTLGYRTFLAADATATAARVELDGENATVTNTAAVLKAR